MGDFGPHEPMSNSGKRQLAKSIIGKRQDYDDIDNPAAVEGGGRLKHMRVDIADNGYSVHHGVEHDAKEGDESTIQPQEHHHVFDDHEKASAHIGALLRGHSEGRKK